MKKYIIKKFIMSNGLPMLREVDLQTGERLTMLPLVSDYDVPIASYKYAGKTLGQISEIDMNYIYWIYEKSNASDRIKKAAARIICGIPYKVPEEDTIVTQDQLYSYSSRNLEERVNQTKRICPTSTNTK